MSYREPETDLERELQEATALLEELGGRMANVLQLLWLASEEEIPGLAMRLSRIAMERRAAITRAAMLAIRVTPRPGVRTREGVWNSPGGPEAGGRRE